MNFLYNIVVAITYAILQLLAVFNQKLKLFVQGRKHTIDCIKAQSFSQKPIWFHTASLGEFEQARPIIESLKKKHPSYPIVVTFFSPSGYEIRKNYALASAVCYLPFDTPKRVQQFVKELNPALAVFVKYEFWPNLLTTLRQENIPTLLVSGIFRKNQVFFSPWGGFMRKALQTFSHFFVQDATSKDLLNSIGFQNVVISGDTRFDRVYQITKEAQALPFMDQFCKDAFTIVAGSTWKEDEQILIPYINSELSPNEKIVIAPHNIDAKHNQSLLDAIQKKTVLYSQYRSEDTTEYQVLLLDTIGILTQVYKYASVAYVGGGLATGLHNILEPAAYGIPVVFGNKKYKKFKEASDLLTLGGCEAVGNTEDISRIFTILKSSETIREERGHINANYSQQHVGATHTITTYIQNNIQI